MSNPNVYITGYGVVCSAGGNAEVCLDNMYQSRRLPGCSTNIDGGTARMYPVFEVSQELSGGDDSIFRTNQLSLCALRSSILHAGYDTDYFHGKRVGVCMGTTIGCQLNNERFYRAYRNGEYPDVQPFFKYLNNNPASVIARFLKICGPCQTINNACSSGTDAIMTGVSWIKQNICDVVIAGGADELSSIALNGFRSLLIMNSSPCTPFDRDRQGLNLGEGAGVLILEKEPEHNVKGEVIGCGFAGDAYHLTKPHPDGLGLKRAIRCALKESGLGTSEIGFINTHGTGTKDNDLTEGKVIEELFPDVPFHSTKGYTGHALGAAGAIEAVFTLAFLERGVIPASIGFQNKDPEIRVIPVTCNTEIKASVAMTQSLAFGGNNSVLILKRKQ